MFVLIFSNLDHMIRTVKENELIEGQKKISKTRYEAYDYLGNKILFILYSKHSIETLRGTSITGFKIVGDLFDRMDPVEHNRVNNILISRVFR